MATKTIRCPTPSSINARLNDRPVRRASNGVKAYFSITTPKGEGGIGVIELFGRPARAAAGGDTLKIINRIFHTIKSNKPITLRPNRIYLGNIVPPGAQSGIDEVIVHFIPARESLTKLDTIEINAHGGIMSCRLIGNLLKTLGVKEITNDEVINLAFGSTSTRGSLQLIQKEALTHLIHAPTELAARILLDQYNGALAKALKSGKPLPELLESAKYGISLTHPKRILILGPPNAGKSTLFNSIIGRERAVTHHLPGTTRDTVEESIAINGFPFVIVDTAGLRKVRSKDANARIEQMGISYAQKELVKADVILYVLDATKRVPDHFGLRIADCGIPHGVYREERRALRIPHLAGGHINTSRHCGKQIIVVLNKSDKSSRINKAHIDLPSITVSALKKTGIDELKNEILRVCGLDRFKHTPGEPIIFTLRQYEWVKERI